MNIQFLSISSHNLDNCFHLQALQGVLNSLLMIHFLLDQCNYFAVLRLENQFLQLFDQTFSCSDRRLVLLSIHIALAS